MAAGMGRQPPAVPAVPAGTAVPGLEDEDEEAPRSPPAASCHYRSTGPPCPVTGGSL
ncbi:MAG: hypothetical protein GX174_10550 [Lentisphaerae bacterium]|nr:hypothetical protein [Lentisphaerota bacterium]